MNEGSEGKTPHGSRGDPPTARHRSSESGPPLMSTLPLEAFHAGDPLIGEALSESAVLFFLKHMTSVSTTLPKVDVEGLPRREEITAEEMESCARNLAEQELSLVPNLAQGLEDERFWILTDLCQNGAGLTRLRASMELRKHLDDVCNGETGAEKLEMLLEKIRSMDPDREENQSLSELLDILLLGVSSSLHKSDLLDMHAPAGGDS